MPSFTLVKRSRRRARRRNMSLPIHRGPMGVFVSDRGSSKRIKVLKRARRPKRAKNRRRVHGRRRRRNVMSFGSLKRVRGRFAHVAGRRSRRHPRKRNSGYALVVRRPRRRRRRRNSGLAIIRPRRHRRRRNRGSRRRRNWMYNRPRRHRRRRNSGLVVYRSRRRRHGRRSNPGFLGTFREIFTMDTGTAVLAGTAGLSLSLWGPKFLGHMVWAPLGRGWGGVATSVVTVGVGSWLIGKASPKAGKAAFIGGLIGSLAGALSAVHCGWRNTVLPFETGLLACALPTNPAKPSPAQLATAANTPGAAPGLSVLGLPLGVVPGMSGYNPAGTPGVAAMLGNEQAWRSAQGGLNDFVTAQPGMRDYVAQIAAGSQGMRDFATFTAQGNTNSSGMDSSPETF